MGYLSGQAGVFWLNHGFDERVLESSKEVEEEEKAEVRKREAMKFYRALDYLL